MLAIDRRGVLALTAVLPFAGATKALAQGAAAGPPAAPNDTVQNELDALVAQTGFPGAIAAVRSAS